jgi:hypothetical protein
MMKFTAFFAIIIGAFMIFQWIYLLIFKKVPELESSPKEIKFHFAAEFLTAAVLITGGIGVLAFWSIGSHLLLVGLGMLIYTTINSAGYFAQKKEWEMVFMFGLIFVFIIIGLTILIDII